ncbi:endonuclease 8-like 1 isoform X3 [Arvicanthis niloticus]|uniref:endonuclease 8-like 1 isoform X3 n=1 Tax=Arvicanthis niloticus TaxID=61156 RepID=UPI00402B9F25
MWIREKEDPLQTSYCVCGMKDSRGKGQELGTNRFIGPSHSPFRMPEGPELHLASHFVNETCKGLVFGGCVEKSSVSRNPEVPFESSAYRISALARGKELRLTLSPLPGSQPPQKPLSLVFRFDIRRFGHWDPGGEWQPGRGPCVLLEYERFRENVLRNLSDKAFDRPICEALLDQRFFNGIGNYLRAEILYRLKIPPFEKARTVLEALQQCRLSPELTLSQKIKAKLQNPDLLELCHLVPKEVVQLGGKGYGPEHGEEDFAAFRAWLRCYGMPGMSSLRDRHGRTIWFQGDPGPLAPKGRRSRKKKSQETPMGAEDRKEEENPVRTIFSIQDLPLSSKFVSRTQRARKHPPKSIAQQSEEASLQQNRETPTAPEKGKRRGRRASTGRRRPPKSKPDTQPKEAGESSAS